MAVFFGIFLFFVFGSLFGPTQYHPPEGPYHPEADHVDVEH